MATHWQQATYRKVGRFAVPILFAWVALLLGLNYIQAEGWADTNRERGWDWYYGYADNLVRHGRYQDCVPEPDSYHCATPLDQRAYRLPGYPLFLAGVMVVAGDNTPQVLKALQAVLWAHIVFMAVHLAQQLSNRRLAVAVGCLLLVSRLTYWVPVAFTEILFAFVLMLFVQVFIQRRWSLSAWLWGGSLLIRSSFIFATPFLLVLMPRRHAVRFIAIVALILIHYTVRNWLVLDTFAPLGTNGGENLRVGHNAQGYRAGGFVDLKTLPDWSTYADLNEVARDKALRHAGLNYAKQHLKDLPMATWRKWNAAMGTEGWATLIIWGLAKVIERRRVATAGRRGNVGSGDRRTHQRGPIFRA